LLVNFVLCSFHQCEQSCCFCYSVVHLVCSQSFCFCYSVVHLVCSFGRWSVSNNQSCFRSWNVLVSEFCVVQFSPAADWDLLSMLCDTFLFIHSFIPAISMAPLQVLYHSDALPTTGRILYRSFTPKRTGKGLAQGPYVTARAGDELTTLRLKVIDSTKAPLRPTIIVVSATLQCTLFAKYMCILLWLCCSFLYL